MAALDFPVIAAPQPEAPEPLAICWDAPQQQVSNPTPADHRKMRASDIRWAGEGENRYPEIRFLGDGYTEQEKEIILTWLPECFGKHSPYAARGTVCDANDVLGYAAGTLHAQAKEQRKTQRGQREVQKAENAQRSAEGQRKHAEWLVELGTWVEQCSARKREIAAANFEWQKRLNEKRVAEGQWDAYVREAKSALQELKQTPAPQRPVKGSTDDL